MKKDYESKIKQKKAMKKAVRVIEEYISLKLVGG